MQPAPGQSLREDPGHPGLDAGAHRLPASSANDRVAHFVLGAGEAAFFLGVKGAGKTRLMMALVLDASSVVILDPTGRDDEWPAFGRAHGFVVTRDPEDIRKYPKVVLLVDQLWLEDRAGWRTPGTPGWNWTLALRYIFERGHTLVVFEEALQTLPATGPNPHARRILSQGRGPKVMSFVALQGMVGVDTYSPRLAEHFFSCRVAHAGDLDAVRDVRRADPTPLTTLGYFDKGKFIPGRAGRKHFGYHRLGSDDWVLCEPLGDYFRGPKRTTKRPSADLGEQPQTQ